MALDDVLVILLAGGAGERLHPLTAERAKPGRVIEEGPDGLRRVILLSDLNARFARLRITTPDRKPFTDRTVCEQEDFEHILDLSFKDVPYRLLRLLSQLLSRHGESGPDGWRLAMPLSLRDLASMVGANEETVGRLLDRYESEGLVRREDQDWVIPDQGALTRALEYASAE